MALRIGGVKKPFPPADPAPDEQAPLADNAPPDVPDAPPDDPTQAEDAGPDSGQDDSGGQGGLLDMDTAGYKSPDLGPFMCSNCQHYSDNNTCAVVSGYIDEAGICNVFTSLHQHGTGAEAGADDQAPTDAAPTDTPPQEAPLPDEQQKEIQ